MSALHVNNQRLFFPLKLPTTAEEPEHWIVRSPWPILIGREKPLVPSTWAASFPVFQAKTGLKRGCWNYLVQWRRRRVASIQGRKWFLDDPFSFLVVSTSSTDCDQFMWIVLEVFFDNSTEDVCWTWSLVCSRRTRATWPSVGRVLQFAQIWSELETILMPRIRIHFQGMSAISIYVSMFISMQNMSRYTYNMYIQ